MNVQGSISDVYSKFMGTEESLCRLSTVLCMHGSHIYTYMMYTLSAESTTYETVHGTRIKGFYACLRYIAFVWFCRRFYLYDV